MGCEGPISSATTPVMVWFRPPAQKVCPSLSTLTETQDQLELICGTVWLETRTSVVQGLYCTRTDRASHSEGVKPPANVPMCVSVWGGRFGWDNSGGRD